MLSENIRWFIDTMRLAGEQPRAIHKLLVRARGEIISERQVYNIFNDFKEGRVTYQTRQRSGRPQSSARVEHVDTISQMISEEPTLTIEQIATTLDLAHTMVERIIKEDLQLKSVSLKWVPHELKQVDKVKRIECAGELLRRYEERNIKKHLIITDEKWVYYRPLGNTATRRCWIHPGGERKAIPKRQMSDKKSMIMVAVTFEGKHYVEVLAQHETVDRDKYLQFLKNVMQHFQNPYFQWRDVILQHDNAKPHVATTVMQYLAQKRVQMLPQAPYSPDTNLCDRFVFPTFESSRCKVEFHSADEILQFTQGHIASITQQAWQNEFEKLKDAANSIIMKAGDYL